MTDERPGLTNMRLSPGWSGRIDIAAATKVGFDPATWRVWIYERADQGGLIVTGAVCSPITRGPRKGQPNFRKHDPATKRTVYLTDEESK